MRKFENNDTTLNLRVNPTVKQQAEDVLKQLGIPMATAIDMYLRTGGIPFSLSLPKAPAALNTDTMTDDQLHAALSDMEQIYSYIADRHYYSAELSEKVVRGMTENVLKGSKYNGGTVPIGFKVDEEKFFQIDPLKAPFVVEAFQRYNDGATMKELMNWLNDSGVTTNRNQKFAFAKQ